MMGLVIEHQKGIFHSVAFWVHVDKAGGGYRRVEKGIGEHVRVELFAFAEILVVGTAL